MKPKDSIMVATNVALILSLGILFLDGIVTNPLISIKTGCVLGEGALVLIGIRLKQTIDFYFN